MALLCVAAGLVALVPLKLWRGTLGLGDGDHGSSGEAKLWAAHVARAAARLPYATKCLPQAMALSWLLRRERVGHAVVLAIRPPAVRAGDNTLHAWVESGGERILGDLPGPWVETLRLGQ